MYEDKPFSKIRTAAIMVFTCCLIIFSRTSIASHAMAVDLTYKCLGSDQYEFTLSFYRDCQGVPAPSTVKLHIESKSCNSHDHIVLSSQGAGIEVSAICNAQISNSSCNGGTLPGVQKYTYKGVYSLTQKCTDWTFSYSQCCRNAQISNLATKNDIYVKATLNNTITSCNSSPEYTNNPVPYICSGQPYSYNHGVIDEDGDSLVYSLINPMEADGKYINYKSGYSVTNPVKTNGNVVFNNYSGQIELTPAGAQVCVVAMQVKEYRNGSLIGTSMRDMQLVVINCSNTTPYITDNGTIQNHSGGVMANKNTVDLCVGEEVSFDIEAKDDDGDDITLTTNVNAVINNATFVITGTGSERRGSFTWQPAAGEEGIYTFSVTIADDACQIPGIQTYAFTIRVLKGTSAGIDKYFCSTGGPVPISVMGGSQFTWELSGGGAATGLSCTNCENPLASPSVTTTYVVTSNLSGTCKNKDTITVYVVPDFSLTISSDTNLCSAEDGVPIAVFPDETNGETYTYLWEPSGGLSDPAVADPVARPAVTTNYYVTVTSSSGCSRRDSVKIEVRGLVDVYIEQGDSVSTCDSLRINTYLIPKGQIFNESFHHEADAGNWTELSGGIVSDECGTVLDEAYYLNGTGNRVLETKNLDIVTNGVIAFYIKAGFCNQCSCDKPENDEQDESLYLEYSIDNGATWKPLERYDADEYALKSEFEYAVVNIPDDAKTNATRFRWIQFNHLLDKDVWILDEISMQEGLGEYSYSWTPAHTVSNDTISNPVVFPNENTTYIVTITDKETGCVFKDSIYVEFKTEFQGNKYTEFTFCPLDTAFQIVATKPAGAIYTYEWYPNNNISSTNIPNPKVAPATTTLYTVVITNPASKCYQREEFLVNVPPDFEINLTADTSLCKGQTLYVNTSVSPAGHYEYLWRPVTNVSNQAIPNPGLNPSKDAEYIVFVKDIVNGCIKSDTLNLKVYPDFKVKTSGTKILCPEAQGVEISVSASPGTNYEYRWHAGKDITNTAMPEQFVKPASDTTYYVLVHQLDGCWKKDSVTVKLYNDVLNIEVSNDTTINEEDIAFLYVSGADRYQWKLQDIMIDTSSSIVVSPETKTTYTVIGYDICDTDTARVVVSVNPMEFFIPNLITPNGDHKNESFKITNFGRRWNLELYNRWGKLIYRKDQYIEEWNGDGQDPGIYYYTITDTKTNQKYHGWLQVVK